MASEPDRMPEQTVLAARGLAFAARSLERELSEMTLAQLRILTLVADDALRASALAERAALTRPTLTGLLDGLTAKGWMERRNVECDRRGVDLSITQTGRTALHRAETEITHALTALLEELPTAHRAPAAKALMALWTASVTRRRRTEVLLR